MVASWYSTQAMRVRSFRNLALASLLLACGAGPEAPVQTPGSAQASSAALGGDSTFVPRGADPLCGIGFKWSNGRCAQAEEESSSATERKAAALARERKSGDGLVIEDVALGSGREVRTGDIVKLHYVGTLADGNIFDSSRSGGAPFEFRVGQGQVIKGFDRGVMGMKVGGRRKVTIPYMLGYGENGAPPRIPPRATLIFDIELIDVI